MKVLCINVPEEWKIFCPKYGIGHPDVGDECLVLKVHKNPGFGKNMFVLKGYNPKYGYAAVNFATLPDRDADEMLEVERESIVNIEKSLV